MLRRTGQTSDKPYTNLEKLRKEVFDAYEALSDIQWKGTEYGKPPTNSPERQAANLRYSNALKALKAHVGGRRTRRRYRNRKTRRHR
jgi:hypothetical protein